MPDFVDKKENVLVPVHFPYVKGKKKYKATTMVDENRP